MGEMLKIELIGPLKKVAGVSELDLKLNGEIKFNEALSMLPEQIKKRVLNSNGDIQAGMIVLINGVEVKSLGLENAYVKDDDKITLIPVIHGG